jgi:hypothetical protein
MWTYILAHWRGQLGLLRSYLLNGVAIFVVLLLVSAAALEFLPRSGPEQIFIYAWLVLFTVWAVWACVGIFRCGVRYTFARQNGIVRRLGGLIAMATVIVYVWFVSQDLYHLFLMPLLHLGT